MTESGSPASGDDQVDLEKAVRYLLHRIRKPSELGKAPYARALCKAFDEPNAVRAVRRLVDTAFPGVSYSEMRLRSLIIRMDFDEELSVEEAADELRVSRRKIQRWRADAVGVLAQRLTEVLHGVIKPELGVKSVVNGNGRSKVPLHVDDAFKAEYSAFCDAQDRSDALKMNMIARNLRRIANPQTLGLAMRCYAESALRLGDAQQGLESADYAGRLAEESRASADFAIVTLLRSEVKLFENDPEAAYRLATHARTALTPSNRAWGHCQILIARSALALSREWDAPPALSRKADQMQIELIAAECRAKLSDWTAVFELAHPVVVEAERLGYVGIGAKGAALLARYHQDAGDLVRYTQMRQNALAGALRSQDFLLASRLLLDPGRDAGNWHDRSVAESLYDRVKIVVPQVVNDDATQAGCVRDLLQEICRVASDPFRAKTPIRSIAERARKLDSAFANYARQSMPTLATMLELTLLAFVERSFWTGQHPGLRKAMEQVQEVFSDCRPTGLCVGFPTRNEYALARAAGE